MEIMASSSRNRKLVFDEIRQSWVKATPEEQIRQLWIQRMVHQLHYPRELFVVEKGLKDLPFVTSKEVPNRRLDILVFGKGTSSSVPLFPLLLLECKQGALSEDALNQVIGYNHFIKAPFVAAVNLTQVQLRVYDGAKNQYIFCSVLPSYKELMQWVTLT